MEVYYKIKHTLTYPMTLSLVDRSFNTTELRAGPGLQPQKVLDNTESQDPWLSAGEQALPRGPASPQAGSPCNPALQTQGGSGAAQPAPLTFVSNSFLGLGLVALKSPYLPQTKSPQRTSTKAENKRGRRASF